MDKYAAVLNDAPDSSSPTAEPVDKYASFFNEPEAAPAATNTQLRASVYSGVGLNPDTAAKQYDLSKETGIPITTVRNKQPEIEKEQRFRTFDFDNIEKKTPALAKSLADPAIAPAIQDDIGRLSKIEQNYSDFKKLLRMDDESQEIDKMSYTSKVTADVKQAISQAQGTNQLQEIYTKQLLRDFAGAEGLSPSDELHLERAQETPNVDYNLDWISHAPAAVINTFGSMYKPVVRAAEAGAVGAVAGGAVGGAAGLGAGGVGAVPGAISGAGLGARKGASLGMTAGIFEQNLTLNYGEIAALKDADGVPMDKNVALGAAVLVSAPNTLLEKFALDKVVEQFPGADKILNNVTKDAVKQAVVNKEGIELFKAIGERIGKAIAVGGLSEGATEWLQTGVEILGKEGAKSASGDNYITFGIDKTASPEAQAEGFERFKKESFGEMSSAAKEAFIGGGALGGVGGGASSVFEHVTAKHQAEVEQNVIKQTVEDVKESKTFQRSPAIFNEVTKETLGKESVYISAQKMQEFFQSGKGTYEDFIASVPEAAYQMSEALESGGDLVLPANKVYAVLAGNEEFSGMESFMRLTPESVTTQEAQDIYEGNVVPEFEVLPEQKAEFEKHDAVRKDFENKLLATGRYTPSQARTNSEIVAPVIKQFVDENDSSELRQRIDQWLQRLVIKSPDKGASVAPYKKVERINQITKALDLIRSGDYDKKKSVKNRPLLALLKKKGGIKSGSVAAQTLKALGINSRTYPGLIKATGTISNLDNIDAFSVENALGDGFQVPADNFNAQEEWLYNRIGDEIAGRAVNNEVSFAEDLEQTLAANNIDIKALTNQEIVDLLGDSYADNVELFQDDDKGPRGSIDINSPQAWAVINIFESHDKSTFAHEAGHLILEMTRDLGMREDAAERTKKKWLDAKEFLGIGEDNTISVDQHEKFADSFLLYLEKGKAPSVALRDTFRAFKAWLSNLWNQFKSLRPDIKVTPEMQDLFDRILASDEEIEVMRNSTIFRPDPNVLKLLTKTERESYVRRNDNQIEKSKEKLLRKLLKEKNREYKKWWKDERKKVRAEVEERVNQSQLYKLLGFLRDGKFPDGTEAPVMPFKMDRAAVIEHFGRDVADSLPANILGKEGNSPEAIADMFGYASAEEMLTALVNAPTRKAQIDQLTDAEMFERHGNMLTDGTIEREALESLQDSDRSNLIAYEFETISRKVNRAKINRDTYKNRARNIIGQKKVKELRPSLYYTAEVRAARESAKQLAKKDYVKAAAVKAQQLLNHYLYREALNARRSQQKSFKLFSKVFENDKNISSRRNIELVSAARALLNKFEYSRGNADPMAVLNQVEKTDPELYKRLGAAIEIAGLQPQDYKELTLDELNQLTDAVRGLWELSYEDKMIEIDGKKIAKEQVIGELAARIREISGVKEKSEYAESQTFRDRTATFINGAKAWLRIVESWADAMDGGKGPFTKYFYNTISDAAIGYRKDKKLYSIRFRELVKDVLAGDTPRVILAPELIQKNGQKSKFENKAQLLQAMLNTGNEGNFRKLLLGEGWGKLIREPGHEVDGKEVEGKVIGLDSSAWDRFSDRMKKEGILTKKDFDFLQKVWDLTEEMKPAAWEAHRKVYGYYPPSVEARAFNNEFGHYRGGYVPLVYDADKTIDVAIRKEIEAMQDNIQSAYPSVSKGFTIARDAGYSAPLSFDLRLMLTHIDRVTKFTNMQPAVSQVNKILASRDFQDNMNEFDSTAIKEMLLPWLNRSAKQIVELPADGQFMRTVSKGLRWLRKRAVQNIMFMNIPNTLEQVTGLSIAKLKVPKGHLESALLDYIKSPSETSASVRSLSDFMSQRMDKEMFDVTQEVNDLILDPTKYQKTVAFFDKNTYIAQAMTQGFVDVVVWSGAYNYAVTLNPDTREAVRYADSAVRLTQGSYSPEDTARFQSTNAIGRLFTTFAGYFNMQANLVGSEWVKIARDMGYTAEAIPRLFYLYVYGFMMPTLVSSALRQAWSGEPVDEDDDGYLDEFLDWFLGSQLRTAAAMIPYVGSVLNAAINSFNEKQYDDKISLSPAVSVLETGIRGIKAPFKEKVIGRDVKDMFSLVGLIAGVPAAPVGRAAGYLTDIDSGKAEPEGALDFTRGLITGKPGKFD